MANVVTNPYLGQSPSAILTRALTGNIFVDMNLAYMNEGDKDGYNVYKYDIKNTLGARTVDPFSSYTSNQQEEESFKRSLVVVESKEAFDPSQYERYWREYQPEGPFQWQGLPAEVQATLEELFLGSSVEATEDLLTNGDVTTNSDLLDGIVTQLRDGGLTSLNGASATSAQIVANDSICFRATGAAGETGDNIGVALTTSNVFDKMELLIKNQSKEMRKRPNRKFMVNHATADLISESQRLELNFKGIDVTEEGIMRYAGYDIIQNPSFPDNTILFASMGGDMKTDAFQLGTSMSSDFNNLAVDRINNFSREWGMVLTFALDIFLVRPEEVCFYTDLDTVN